MNNQINKMSEEDRLFLIKATHLRMKNRGKIVRSFATAIHALAENEKANITHNIDETIDIVMHDDSFMDQDFSQAFG